MASIATTDPKPGDTLQTAPPPDKESTSSEKLSPELADLAVAELRFQTAYYLECIQAIMDGVTLGAEQVQDKRVEFLEAGPTTEPGSPIILFAISFILQGTIGPAIAALAFRTLLRPMLKGMTRAIGRQYALKSAQLQTQTRLFTRYYTDAKSPALKEAIKNIVTDLKKAQGALESSKAEVWPILNSIKKATDFAQANLIASAKSKMAADHVAGSAKQLETGASYGADILASAMASTSKLRLAAIGTHEVLEAEMRHPDTKLSEVIAMLNDYRVDTQFDLETIRESVQVATEAMIWAKILLDPALLQADEVRNSVGDWRFQPMKDPWEVLRGILKLDKDAASPLRTAIKEEVDEKFISYLFLRFKTEIMRGGTEIPSQPTGAFRKLLVDGFLKKVLKATPSDFKIYLRG